MSKVLSGIQRTGHPEIWYTARPKVSRFKGWSTDIDNIGHNHAASDPHKYDGKNEK